MPMDFHAADDATNLHLLLPIPVHLAPHQFEPPVQSATGHLEQVVTGDAILRALQYAREAFRPVTFNHLMNFLNGVTDRPLETTPYEKAYLDYRLSVEALSLVRTMFSTGIHMAAL